VNVVSIIDNNMAALLSMAIDATVMRQQAIAQNIANVSTPGYQRVSVSFESRMAAMAADTAPGAAPSLADLSNYRPSFEYASGTSAPVALDMELADMSETVLHHQALMKALGKHLELVSLAINEGKR
jgi:flagellar basal-body rod protein FlgB